MRTEWVICVQRHTQQKQKMKKKNVVLSSILSSDKSKSDLDEHIN